MTRNTRDSSDPIEQEIELALSHGDYIPDGMCFSFVHRLDDVETRIARLIASAPSRAATLYEAFLAAYYLKIEELDDSSGSFGMFVDGLYCGWLNARQADGADPNESSARLLEWMDNDDYGFRRASTTTPRCPTSREPGAASSAPASAPNGRRP